jgi:1-acyl-sn-glycerol-3-phosphate acyltransferase
MANHYRVPVYNRIFRWLFRPVFRFLFHILCKVKINGLDNIPHREPYLVAINHVSLYEPPFILAFWPRPLEAVGAVEIWSRQGQSILARLYGGIRVHRGQFDRQLIDQMTSAVQSGYPLLIAPEGGRTHTIGMRRGLPGAAYIANKADFKVVPVGIAGTSDDFFPRILASFFGQAQRVHLEMNIGKPIQLPAISGRGEARRQALQQNVDQIMIHIGLLLPEPYHGEYSGHIRQFKQSSP